MPNQKLGWVKDKFDHRDFLHKTAIKVPDKVDLSQYLPNVRDQGNVGSCVGFGVGANVGSVAKKLKIFTEWFSPTWIYNGARYIEGKLTQDAGCEPGDALDWLLKMGCLLEHFWLYDPTKLDQSAPSSTREAQATKYPNFAYFRCVDGVDGICSALASGYLVSIGTPWFDKWMNIASNGKLPTVSSADSVAGGHETILAGYDKTTALFYGQNSWGMSWGGSGRYYMPFQAFGVFKQLGGYDAHYIQFNPVSPTPVPPSPAPSTGVIPVGAYVAQMDGKDNPAQIYGYGTWRLVRRCPYGPYYWERTS